MSGLFSGSTMDFAPSAVTARSTTRPGGGSGLVALGAGLQHYGALTPARRTLHLGHDDTGGAFRCQCKNARGSASMERYFDG
jgi:hypothetical protein